MNRLKSLRTEQKMSQERLAELSGVYQETLSRIESGQRKMGIEVALKVAPHLNTDPLYLMGHKNLQEITT